MSSQASDIEDEVVLDFIEKILFTECQPCSVLKLSRRANCITTQAYRCLHDFYTKTRQKHDGLRPIHIVKGLDNKDGITVEVTRIVEQKDLKQTLSSLESGEDRGIYALSIGPIQDLHSLLRGDHVESPQFQYADGRLSAVDGEELALRFRSQMSETAEAERAAAAAVNEAYEIELKQQQDAKKKPKKAEKSIQAMFEKAVQQTSSPQKAAPLPKSPFDSPIKKEQTPKKRGRKVVTESDDDFPPQKIAVAEKNEKQLTPVRKSSKVSASYDDIFDADDGTPEKKVSQEFKEEEKKSTSKKAKANAKSTKNSTKVLAPVQKVKQPNKSEARKSGSPDSLDTTALEGPKRKKIVKVQGQETLLDEDGFMVTRPAMVEMEVDDNDDDQSQKKKDQERALKPSNTAIENKTAAKGKQQQKPGGQRSIAAFFSKK